MSDTFNGYANRETWAFNLHWQNDQGLYVMILDAADAEETNTRALGEAAVSCLEELLSDDELISRETERMLRHEIGSFWRIDRAEVGDAIRESLIDEGYVAE